MLNNERVRTAFNVTFNTTEECNLACKYCYEISKHANVLSFDHAKKFIDLLLNNDDVLGKNDKHIESLYNLGITLDFIGGDSFMNVDLLDKIVSYWIRQVNLLNTKNARRWRDNYRFSISTNGTLFSNPEVRRFCEKYKEILSIGVSIDGCPTIHDMNRIFKDGKGSMDVILANWDWYKKTFPNEALSTKATCARDSIPYLFESLKWMHETLGLKYINQNFIMEDTHCTEEDYIELRKQMQMCIDYVYEHRDSLYWSMIDEHMIADYKNTRLADKEEWNKGRCGGGGMPALSVDGKIYPCFRFLPHTLADYEGASKICVGDVDNGFVHQDNFAKVLDGAKRCNCTKDPKCLDCEYESACSYCIGGCYSEFGEFRRTTYICEITKIQCEYAKKYWDKIKKDEEENGK